MVTCSIEGCEKGAWSRGMCGMHYQRWNRLGVTDLADRPSACSVPGCDRGDRLSFGMCHMHYTRNRRHGSPRVVKNFKGENNPAWTGDDATYYASHLRVRSAKGSARLKTCDHCGSGALHWAYDHLDPNEKRSAEGPYSPSPDHYIPLCVTCHSVFDRTVPYMNEVSL